MDFNYGSAGCLVPITFRLVGRLERRTGRVTPDLITVTL